MGMDVDGELLLFRKRAVWCLGVSIRGIWPLLLTRRLLVALPNLQALLGVVEFSYLPESQRLSLRWNFRASALRARLPPLNLM